MKTNLILLLMFLFSAVTFTQAQSKKDLEKSLAACSTTRDSLQKVLSGIPANYDSINKAFIVYDTMYNVIKKKVFNYAFNPTHMSLLLDSLRTSRDSAFSGLHSSFSDSISFLNKENAELRTKMEILKAELVNRTYVIKDLQQLKELLDDQIITQEEYNAKKAKLLEKL